MEETWTPEMEAAADDRVAALMAGLDARVSWAVADALSIAYRRGKRRGASEAAGALPLLPLPSTTPAGAVG